MKPTLTGLVLLLFLISCQEEKGTLISVSSGGETVIIDNAGTRLEIARNLHFDITGAKGERSFPVTDPVNKQSSVSLTDTAGNIMAFTKESSRIRDIEDVHGRGKKIDLAARSENGKVSCTVSIYVYDRFPGLFLSECCFKNISPGTTVFRGYSLNRITLRQAPGEKWMTFQGAAYYWGQDFIFQLPDTFRRQNYMGLNALKAGAGIPMSDIWNENFGTALAYLAEKPEDVSLPVVSGNGTVELCVEKKFGDIALVPGDSLITVSSAIIIHEGDFFEPLKLYSALIHSLLPGFQTPPDYARQPEWCTWGYNRNFTVADIMEKTGRLKQLGIRSVIIDDGWSVNHGDWTPDPAKFPAGDKDFRRLTDTLHKSGFRVWLWWVPGYAESTSSLARLHPDWFIRNRDGSVHPSGALCPAYAPVQEYFKDLVRKFTEEYGLDGLKLDFGEINTAPPCYNPAHNHKDPNESYVSTPELFRNICETAKKYNPDILLEYCACGIPPNIYHLPYVNLAVTSDPSIGQITGRIKMYKALMGQDFPVLEEYCGVLAGPVYQLVIGSGGVPGTFSTYLDDYHKKWLSIYEAKGLSNGEYLNLYNTGFDYPEGHAIKKDGNFFYAFYTHPWEKFKQIRWFRFGNEFDSKKEGLAGFDFPPEKWSGKIDLRGLDRRRNYRIINYENSSEIGTVNGFNPVLEVTFVNYLLLEAIPD